MSALSTVLRGGEGGRLSFWCPGCKSSHTISTEGPPNATWGWNGDVDKPIFTPSVLMRQGHYAYDTPQETCWCTYNAANPDKPAPFTCERCHSFVGCNGAQPGQIIFLGDCTHALAGQVVDLPPWPTNPSTES